ncbi:MAG TPA: DUF2721 domain-containing protein [Blastocatellia bacterium]|nr:DUF2721 domain-containing protein [Blastocatellia bacterium]
MFDSLSSVLSILTAMITPAVLISACGSLILSTSTRLGRVVDRVRELSDRFERMAQEDNDIAMAQEKRAMIFDQLDRLTSRARILQRSLTSFYSALGIFVATSFAIGLVAIIPGHYAWIPVVLGLLGAALLFYGSVLQILEARQALAATYREMDFIWAMGKHYAPSELVDQRAARKRSIWRPR